MVKNQYQVIFNGRIETDTQIEDVRTNLAEFFNVKRERFSRLTPGTRLLIKKHVDQQAALRIQATFRRAGAYSDIIPQNKEFGTFRPLSPPMITPPSMLSPGHSADNSSEELHGLPIHRQTIFTDHKGKSNPKTKKRQSAFLESIPYIQPFLKKEEKILLVTTGLSHASILEQYLTGWILMVLKRSLFVFTNKRILHIPTKRNYAYRHSMAQILYPDCSSIKMGIGNLIIRYKNNKRETFSIFSKERQKIKALLNTISLQGESSAFRQHHHLCPQCRHELVKNKYSCPICQLAFKNKSKARKLSILYPGGGYFYTGHPVMGIIDAIAEFFLMINILFSLYGVMIGVKGGLAELLLGIFYFTIEKLITIYHSNRFIDEYILETKEFQSDIPIPSDRALRKLSVFRGSNPLVRMLAFGFTAALILSTAQFLCIAPHLNEAIQQNQRYEGVYQAIRQKNYTQALTECDLLAQQFPDDPWPCHKAGSILMVQGQYEKSFPRFIKALAVNPTDIGTLQDYAHARERWGDMQGALQLYDQALSQSIQQDQSGPSLLKFLAGSIHWQERNFRRLRGEIFQKTGKYQKAIQEFSTILTLLNEEENSGIQGLAKKQSAKQMKQSGQQCVVDFIDEDQGKAYVNLGQISLKLGDDESAFRYFTKAIENAYNNGDGWFGRAKAHRSRGQEQMAEHDFQQAIRYYTEDIEDTFLSDFTGAVRFIRRGDAYLEFGHLIEAKEDYTRAIHVDQDYMIQSQMEGVVSAYCRLGDFNLQIGRQEEAFDLYAKAIALCPYDPQPFLCRGRAKKTAGMLREAMEDFSKAVQYSNFLAEALYERASVNWRTRNHDSALKDLKIVVQNTQPSLKIHQEALSLLNRR